LAKILIVDDSATSRSIAARLIGENHELFEAATGRAALDLISANGFDLVLLDLLMPDMSGFDVLSQLASGGSVIPVIVVTADIQNTTKARAKALGAALLIHKPLSREVLLEAIETALRLPPPAALPDFEPALKDGFAALMNEAFAKAADVLNTMMSFPIALSVPAIEMISARELSARFSRSGPGKLSAVGMRCSGGLDASIELIFTSEDALGLADCVLGIDEPGERDSMRAGALCEIGNIVINAVLGTMSNSLKLDLSFTVPCYLEGEAFALVDEISLGKGGVILLVKTRFEVKDLRLHGDIAIFLSLASFESLSAMLRLRAGG